jgi:hypothetical protein
LLLVSPDIHQLRATLYCRLGYPYQAVRYELLISSDVWRAVLVSYASGCCSSTFTWINNAVMYGLVVVLMVIADLEEHFKT